LPIRTVEEIKKQLTNGEAFVKRHPYSIFGTDNTEYFRIFKKIIEKAQNGQTRDMIEDFLYDSYNDELASFGVGILEWLFLDDDEEPYSDLGDE